jgi:hypothetical protein
MWRSLGRLLVLPAVAAALALSPASSQAKVEPYGYNDAGGSATYCRKKIGN